MAVKKKKKRTTTRRTATKSKNFQNALVAILVIVLLVCVGLIGYSLYYFNSENRPLTHVVGEVDSLTYAPEQTYAFEVQLYTNEKQNGIPAYEWRANYYIDTLIPNSQDAVNQVITNNTVNNELNSAGVIADCFKTVYSSGVQMLGDSFFELKTSTQTTFMHTAIYGEYVPKGGYYYNTTEQDVSYAATDKLDYNDKWIIDFGENSLGRITQDVGAKQLKWTVFASNHMVFNINMLMHDFYQTISSLEYGKQVVVFKLSDYLTFEYFDTSDCKFHPAKADDEDLFVNILVNKSANGIVDHSQSLFGIVENNANWSFDNIDNIDYWKSTAQVYLNASDFDNNSGTFAIKAQALEYYKSFNPEALDIVVDIDLDTINAVRFDNNSFGGIIPKAIILRSSTAKTIVFAVAPPCTVSTVGHVTYTWTGGGN